MMEWWLPDYLLALADRLSMAHSIELRCPFLDNEFADLCLRLSARDRVGYPWSRFKGKSLLKAAALPRLGVEFIRLPKRGFENPVQSWLRKELAGPARREIEAPNRLAREVLDRSVRQELFGQMMAGDERATSKVWALIVLNKWAEKWM
jgi:asparagine synthase (glutamine-hydrolysing)